MREKHEPQHPESFSPMTFWEHLEVLRHTLIRIGLVIILFSILAFCCKDEVFSIILAPKNDNFLIYDVSDKVADLLSLPRQEHFSISLINTGLADQFKTHVSASLYTGLLLASPYIIYQLFSFISPALYANERKYSFYAVSIGYMLFLSGVLLCYFLIFPLTFRFLGTYQVSPEIKNMISLQSYMDTLLVMSFLMGLMFELPILCWLLGILGILSAHFMKHYRKHAIIVILILAAIITPTSDVFTLCLVALPICLLYEISIWVVRK